jgi:hypothetical protein
MARAARQQAAWGKGYFVRQIQENTAALRSQKALPSKTPDGVIGSSHFLLWVARCHYPAFILCAGAFDLITAQASTPSSASDTAHTTYSVVPVTPWY